MYNVIVTVGSSTFIILLFKAGKRRQWLALPSKQDEQSFEGRCHDSSFWYIF